MHVIANVVSDERGSHVPMTPAIAAGFLPARLSITGWMLLFAVLGLAIVRKKDRR